MTIIIVALVVAVILAALFMQTDTDYERFDFSTNQKKMNNAEFEFLFRHYASLVNKNTEWVDTALDSMLDGYRYYSDNIKAVAFLHQLMDLTNGVGNEEVRRFVMSCSAGKYEVSYRKLR